MNMKKMYKKPNVETTEVHCSTILTGSTVVNNEPLSGGNGGSNTPTADAPVRRTPVF